MKNLNLLFADTPRSKIYIRYLIKNKFCINNLIIYSKKKLAFLNKYRNNPKINNFILIKEKNLNSDKLKYFLKKSKLKKLIYSGYPGEVVTQDVLSNFKLIHIHPGNLPFFKGSTTLYYTILEKRNIYCTVFYLNRHIDSGKIIFKKNFPYPKKIHEIEKTFDDTIRAKTLVSFLKNKNIKSYKTKNNKNLKNNYYIAHPIIRQLVINKKVINKLLPKRIND